MKLSLFLIAFSIIDKSKVYVSYSENDEEFERVSLETAEIRYPDKIVIGMYAIEDELCLVLR